MAGVVDPVTTTTFTMQMDCIFAELDLINRQLDISDHLISEMERWVSFLPRSVPLLSPPRVASPLPPNTRAALPSPSPNVAVHHLLGRFPASDTALASDGQRPRAPNIARRILVDPLHGQRDGDAPTPRHLLHLRASLLDAPRRHGATTIFVPPSSAPNANRRRFLLHQSAHRRRCLLLRHPAPLLSGPIGSGTPQQTPHRRRGSTRFFFTRLGSVLQAGLDSKWLSNLGFVLSRHSSIFY
jgi:hypothetical protein